MKLNLGSGERRIKGFQGVDLYAPGAEIKADLRTVHFPVETIEAAVCYHVIEHLTYTEGVTLISRAFHWLKPGAWIAFETPDRLKCIQLIKDRKMHRDGHGIERLIGGVGICGGRPLNPQDQQRYQNWIRDHADLIVKEAEEHKHVRHFLIPPQYQSPGASHVHVWSEAELRQVMEETGFKVRSERPETHGRRKWRDMRLVGVKP